MHVHDGALPARPAAAARVRWAGTAAGLVGPAAFTAAWAVASLRQPGPSPAGIQISGLAAPGARDPWIMQAGFLVLGGCLLAFGPSLRQALASRGAASRGAASRGAASRGAASRGAASRGAICRGPASRSAGPWLIEAAGALVIAAGLLRRDHMLLTAGVGSWHQQAHNAVSGAIYLLLIVTPLVLAVRLRRDRHWRPLPALFTAAAAASAVILTVFAAAGPDSPQAGMLQRAGVTIPLAALMALAARLSRPAAGSDPPAHRAGGLR
jgi:hypothetical membrane protein